jgi:hypothetical protein
MDNLFSTLTEAHSIAKQLESTIGRSFGLTLGFCVDRSDPDNFGRIKASLPSKGANFKTDWLWRSPFMPGVSPVSPRIGDLVTILYVDGDPHKGFYLGAVQNLNNPAGDVDTLSVYIGKTLLTIKDGQVNIGLGHSGIKFKEKSLEIALGNMRVKFSDDGRITLDGVTSYIINGVPIDPDTQPKVVLDSDERDNDGLPWVYPT